MNIPPVFRLSIPEHLPQTLLLLSFFLLSTITANSQEALAPDRVTVNGDSSFVGPYTGKTVRSHSTASRATGEIAGGVFGGVIGTVAGGGAGLCIGSLLQTSEYDFVKPIVGLYLGAVTGWIAGSVLGVQSVRNVRSKPLDTSSYRVKTPAPAIQNKTHSFSRAALGAVCGLALGLGLAEITDDSRFRATIFFLPVTGAIIGVNLPDK